MHTSQYTPLPFYLTACMMEKIFALYHPSMPRWMNKIRTLRSWRLALTPYEFVRVRMNLFLFAPLKRLSQSVSRCTWTTYAHEHIKHLLIHLHLWCIYVYIYIYISLCMIAAFVCAFMAAVITSCFSCLKETVNNPYHISGFFFRLPISKRACCIN